MAATTMALVQAYTEADQDWTLHTQTCFDQREIYGCDRCTRLNAALEAARRAMRADDAAVTLYESDEMRAQRRCWNREVFDPMARQHEEDDY